MRLNTATAAFAVSATMLSAVSAQNMTGNYSAGLLAGLNSTNLTTLSTVLSGFPDLIAALQMGNYTVFAPSNAAFAALPAGLNSSQIESTLMYHVTPAHVTQAALGFENNHTIVPSLLQEPLLGRNVTAPLVASFGTDGFPRIRTALQNVTVGANLTYQNLLVHVVDMVISPPTDLNSTVAELNLTSLAGALTAVAAELPLTALEATPRLTVFAPNNAAFANISAIIGTLNASTIADVLGNHVINGSVVYSTAITASTTAVSAAGETLSFQIMNGSVYVMNGPARAQIIRTDVPISNGVLHVIDAVLANTMANGTAAAAAESTYAAMATSTAGAAGAAAAQKGAGIQNAVAFTTLVAALIGAAAMILA